MSHELLRGRVPVKLPQVEYEAPTTVAEAVGLLAEHHDEASVLANNNNPASTLFAFGTVVARTYLKIV